MDNVCHTLLGAAMAEAGLKRSTRFAAPALLIAANLPDIDVLVFATSIPSVAFRRGWTHGILAQIVLPVILAAALIVIDRVKPPESDGSRAKWAPLLLLGYLGVLSHVALDYLNNYGIRLLMPLSNRWFYGDAVFIVDPWLWLMLGAGVVLARRRLTPSPARRSLVYASAYLIAMLVSARAACTQVLDAWAAQHGEKPQALMVGPVFLDPFHKQVIVDRGDGYQAGSFSWFSRSLRLDEEVPTRAQMPAAAAARTDPQVQALLVWARFPYYEIETERWGTRVIVRDMRFGRFIAATSVLVNDAAPARAR